MHRHCWTKWEGQIQADWKENVNEQFTYKRCGVRERSEENSKALMESNGNCGKKRVNATKGNQGVYLQKAKKMHKSQT